MIAVKVYTRKHSRNIALERPLNRFRSCGSVTYEKVTSTKLIIAKENHKVKVVVEEIASAMCATTQWVQYYYCIQSSVVECLDKSTDLPDINQFVIFVRTTQEGFAVEGYIVKCLPFHSTTKIFLYYTRCI